MTPSAIEQDNDEGNWDMRLFPNRFPAVEKDAKCSIEFNLAFAAVGSHEVLVETADHFAQAFDYSVTKWLSIFQLWQRRLRALYQVQGTAYVHIFRNQGYRGGATLVHPHQQIVSLPVVPDYIERRISKSAFDQDEGCQHCRWVAFERDNKVRILEERCDSILLVAFAPRFSFEMQILSSQHMRFDELSNEQLLAVAEMLSRSLKALARSNDNPDYNLVLFSTPPNRYDAKLWAIDIIPRIGTQAGFEWGTGVHIVSMPPEEAARTLRSHWPD